MAAHRLTARDLTPLLLGLTFHANAAETAWLIAALYVATSVRQPMMGRLADVYGAAPVFHAGVVLTIIAGVGGSLAPGWVC